ncbi:NADH:flavin oxidoreductase [Nocardia sp. NPDC051052]|uniref:NADH:flavin oxidoreductase n=1 Tax=Nocardia sp. NPDC051052 TaxID=3364322 RepID=UPI0037A9770E
MTSANEIVDSRTQGVDGLYEPFELKSLHLRNRFAMAPMTRQFSPEGVPGEDVAEYYRRRAAGGVGLIITEGTYIPDPAAGESPRVPRIYGQDSLAGWRRVVDAVHEVGGAIVPQLWHVGVTRGERPDLNPDVPSVSPSGLTLDGDPLGHELSSEDLDQLRQWYVDAALDAQRVGFDGLELHGAHGYLLDQFMWERTNLRTDSYGGSIPSRSKFPAEVVAAIRAAVGPDFAIIYRFSQWKSNSYRARLAQTPAELADVLTPLVDAGVDILHASTRRHWLPAFEDLPGTDGVLGLAGWTKKVTGVPTITVGSIGLDTEFTSALRTKDGAAGVADIDRLVQQYERGEFDLAAVGRALISDPEWVNKLRAGRTDEFIPFDNTHRKTLH